MEKIKRELGGIKDFQLLLIIERQYVFPLSRIPYDKKKIPSRSDQESISSNNDGSNNSDDS